MSPRNLGKTDQPDGVGETGRWVKVLGETRLLPVSGRPMQRVAAIGRVQRGRVARRLLLAAGIPSSVIGGMITHGLLRPEHAGVYAVLDARAVPLARETAALLASGDRAILSHMSAAALGVWWRRWKGQLRSHSCTSGPVGGGPGSGFTKVTPSSGATSVCTMAFL